MAVLNVKWDSREERDTLKMEFTEKIKNLVGCVAISLYDPGIKDACTTRLFIQDVRAAIKAYWFFFDEVIEYDITPDQITLSNLTRHSVIRTFTRKEVINDD